MKSICFVDDEKISALQTSRMLERHGVDVKWCQNPLDVIAMFADNSSAYDVVITDINMPELMGYELAEKLKSIRSDLIIVALSSYLPEKYEGPFDLKLRKPIRSDDIPKINFLIESRESISDIKD